MEDPVEALYIVVVVKLDDNLVFLTEIDMAKNPSKNNARKGAVIDRSQFQHPNGNWVKRDRATGQFLDQKSTPGLYKGIAKEPDHRQDK